MDLKEYYERSFDKLKNGFSRSHYVLGAGLELIAKGWDPNGTLVTVQPVDQLWNLTVNDLLQVYLPVVNCRNDVSGKIEQCESILWPFDFEIYLKDQSIKLYEHQGSQFHYFDKHIEPVKNYLCDLLENHRIPHVLDYTPSGGHFLTHILRDSDAWNALKSIGYEDKEVISASTARDINDIKRNPPMDYDATMVYSGLCMITEYIALKAKQDVRPREDLPITICDSEDKCVNLDISWTYDPAYMRIIRAPFSAHKKRSQNYHVGPEPLIDVMGRYYDANGIDIKCDDLGHIINCMWNFSDAVKYNEQFHGHIPFANQGMVNLVNEYKQSQLKAFHDYCHYGENDLQRGEAEHRARNHQGLDEKTINMIDFPNPRMVQPSNLRKFVMDLASHGWHPKHIKCLIADKCREDHNWSKKRFGVLDYKPEKYIPEKAAWSIARQYSAAELVKNDPTFWI